MEEQQNKVGSMLPQQDTESQQQTKEPQNVEEPTPKCVGRFNAGAFTFTWIWGICNGVWLSLLVFIPIVGIIFRFILGFGGNEMAWEKQKNRHVDLEVFDKRQSIWSIVGWIILGVFLVYCIVVILCGILL